MGIPRFTDLFFQTAALIAFALSFSNTVFAVKSLEENGEMGSLHGRIAIGILIMQDILAVLFLTVSTGKIPSLWAIGCWLRFYCCDQRWRGSSPGPVTVN
ncbi:MAG: cation:proton antiporter [Candidatus Synoicihabitans palmerolidicus]|nr:cation:proton antiporter [Candidatus Synoicihabitans palmerolidicus]